MPVYEFRCADCGKTFDKLYRRMISGDSGETPPCPACGSASTSRLVSSFAVHGPAGVDVGQVAAETAQANREASITPKDQINRWRSARK
ncbi:MAG: FmdB family zinc ribbon protein [Anaerolineae bacterium]|jgi:putative FmdB family regulatory protein